MKILAVVPARGGSKGIPRKNIRPLLGKPLIAWTIDATQRANQLDRTIISTEDQEIADVARAEGAEVPFMRPPTLAKDDTPTLPVIQHALHWLEENEGYRPDAVMILQPTSPLRQSHHIDEAIQVLKEDPQADSLVSCINVPHHFHPRKVMRRASTGYLHPYRKEEAIVRRQDLEPLVARNGAAIYLARREVLDHGIFGSRLLPFMMVEGDSVDIDEVSDFEKAEQVLKCRSELDR
jgi:CMP-N,N'-diacetyllegionaminic acid synthase